MYQDQVHINQSSRKTKRIIQHGRLEKEREEVKKLKTQDLESTKQGVK